MKLAIMQPYFVPYLGYWQMINFVDRFILLDNVNYIKQGFINRNSIMIGNIPKKINILLSGASSNKLIKDIELNSTLNWKKKLLKTIEQEYRRAPYFITVFELIEDIILNNQINLSRFLYDQINVINKYLEIKTEIIQASDSDYNCSYTGEDRIIELCKLNNASEYLNSIGGKNLYSKAHFRKNGIDLKFIKMGNIWYKQFNQNFQPNLSIVDVMMFNSVEEIKIKLENYEIE